MEKISVHFPIGVFDDPDRAALGLENPGDDARGGKRMIDVDFAGDQNNVPSRRAEAVHFKSGRELRAPSGSPAAPG